MKKKSRRVSSYRVPLGEPLLLLEPGVLAPVVDGGEDLPHEDEHEADGDDGPDHPQDDPHDVHHHGALLRRLHPHLQLACKRHTELHSTQLAKRMKGEQQ